MIQELRYPLDIGSSKWHDRHVTFKVTDAATKRQRKPNLNSVTEAKGNSWVVDTAGKVGKGLNGTGITQWATSSVSSWLSSDDAKELKDDHPDDPSLIAGIMLPLPDELSDSAEHTWESKNGLSAVAGDIVGKMASGSVKWMKDKILGTGDTQGAISKFINGITEGGDIKSSAAFIQQVTTGHQYISDPASWQMYQGSKPRSFSMSYTFIPNSHEEAEQIIKIITAFKAYSAPRLMSGDFVLEAPFFWEIEISNQTISELIKMDNIVITKVNVSYGNSGIGIDTFADGMPKKIIMGLELSESQPPYRNEYTPAEEKSKTNPANAQKPVQDTQTKKRTPKSDAAQDTLKNHDVVDETPEVPKESEYSVKECQRQLSNAKQLLEMNSKNHPDADLSQNKADVETWENNLKSAQKWEKYQSEQTEKKKQADQKHYAESGAWWMM